MIAVKTIDGGSNGFNTVLYAPPDQRLTTYLQNNLSNAYQTFQHQGQNALNTITSMYEKFNSDEAINRSIAVMQAASIIVDPLQVQYLDIDTMNTANMGMRKYIMVNPMVHELNRTNRCAGFGGEVLMSEPDAENVEDTYEYQRVMNGIVQYDKEDNGYAVHYSNNDPENVELRFLEQTAVMDTWLEVEKMINMGLDPTSLEMDGEL